MDQPGKTTPRKNTKISFRTDETTLAKLKVICRAESKTISALIEEVLTQHVLREETPVPCQHEKRTAPRKKCSIPVVISSATGSERRYFNGMIVSFSMTSIQIVLSEPPIGQLLGQELHALFSIPTKALPLLLSCVVTRLDYVHDECVMVASLRHDDPEETDCIEKFLTHNDFAATNRGRARLS